MEPRFTLFKACIAWAVIWVFPAIAQFSHPGCGAISEADFKLDTLIRNAANPALKEPMKMAFDMDLQGNVDIYFTQRGGLLRKYGVTSKTISDMANFSSYPAFSYNANSGSDGLIGVALDPAFKNKAWVYLYISTTADWRVSRITLAGGLLDMATEKILIKITQARAASIPAGR